MMRALSIHAEDNVATALEDIASGEVTILGEASRRSLTAVESIRSGHKVALRLIAAGEPVVKFGVTIGRAIVDIPEGAWVHTHNCSSGFDARSSTLDRHTGAPTDTRYD